MVISCLVGIMWAFKPLIPLKLSKITFMGKSLQTHHEYNYPKKYFQRGINFQGNLFLPSYRVAMF